VNQPRIYNQSHNTSGKISPAKPKHLQAINNIYNQAVKDGFRTAHTEQTTMEDRTVWFYNHTSQRYPIFIFEQQDQVLGWLSLSAYRFDRQALDEVVEVSYYVDYAHHRQGIASKLLQHAINFSKQAGYRIMVALLVEGNEGSIKLLEKFAFHPSGSIPAAIHHEDEYRDHLYYSKKIR